MKRKIILSLVALIIFAVSFLAWKVFGAATRLPEGKFFYIKTGESFQEMKENLVKTKILKTTIWFDWVAQLRKFKTVKAGKYLIKEGTSIFNLIKILKIGQQTPVNLVITKSRLLEGIAQKMGRVFEFDSAATMSFINNNDSLKQFGLDTTTLIAALLPNTYSFFWNTTPRKVLQKLVEEWHLFWNEERKAKADKLGLSPVQVTTLASIIDEESNYAPEKNNIASVYLNRLKLKMPLQADPTIKFALKDFGLKRIYERHLLIESPYNTYRIQGLPPGPICTPQPQTIDAVLNAPETNYLYFVAKSDFSGTHEFTANYHDHLIKAKEFQKAMDKQDSIRKANK